MPSQFGGIPVDEHPSGGQFGGIPVDETAPAEDRQPIIGAAETAATIGTGMVSGLGGGLAYLPALAAGGSGPAEAAKGAVENAFTYQPRTATGKEYVAQIGEKLGTIFDAVHNLGAAVGLTGALGFGAEEGTPAAGLGVAVGTAAPDALANLAGVRAAPRLPVPSAPVPAATATTESVSQTLRTATRPGLLREGSRQRATSDLAEGVKPDADIVGAVRDVGMSPETVPPEVVSGSEPFRIAAGAARSVPGSELQSKYRQFLSDLGDRAESLKAQANAKDIATVNAEVESRLTADIDRARAVEKELYDGVDKTVDAQFGRSVRVEARPIYDKLMSEIDAVGGDVSKLSPLERQLLGRFATKNAGGGYSPRPDTWGGITKLRRELNAMGEVRDAASFDAAQYARLVSETQKQAADALGIGDQFREALKATGVKKTAIEAAEALTGARRDKSFSVVFDSATRNLAAGRVKEFEATIQSVPAELRGEAVTSFVFSKIIDPRNMDSRVNIAGFNRWFNELSSNPSAKAALYKYLGPDTRKTVESLGKVVSAVKRANEDAIKTGLINSADEGFSLADSIVGKLLRTAAIGTATAKAGPVAGAGAAAVTAGKGAKTISQAAAEVMSSPEFQNQVQNVIRRAGSNTLVRGEESLMASKPWRKFFASLTPEQRKTIRNVGITSWLMSADEDYREQK